MNNDRITELYKGEIGAPDSQRRARARIHWLCAQAQGERVLDVGCSQGIASILLAREGREVTGVDNEHAALDYARSELEQEEPHVADRVTLLFAEGADLPFEDDSFDTVLLGEVLEHQLDPRPLLNEARRVLREDGVVVITSPYGIFRYQDHKEPIYLEPLLELLEQLFGVERIELVERWIGVVARGVKPAAAGMRPQAWALALHAAETQLASLDATLEERREALKATQGRLADTRAERDQLRQSEHRLTEDLKVAKRRAASAGALERRLAEAREELAAARAQQAADAREIESLQNRITGLEDAEQAAHRGRLDAERRLASTAGQLEAAGAEAARAVQRAGEERREADALRRRLAEADVELEALHERVRALAVSGDAAERRLAQLEEQAQGSAGAAGELEQAREAARTAEAQAGEARRAAAELERRLADAETERERAELLDQRLAAAAAELELARERIRRLGDDRDEQDRALAEADERAARLERELAVTQVELADLRERPRPAPADAPAADDSEATGNGNPSPPGPPSAFAAPAAAPHGAVATIADAAPSRPVAPAAPAPSVNGDADPRALARSAAELLREGEDEAAAAAYAHAVELEPDRAAHWLGLARAQRNLKQLEDALGSARRALELRPGWSDALWIALALTSRLDLTAEFLELAAELGPLEEWLPTALERVGPLALRAGAHDLARAAGEELLARKPLHPTGLLTSARAFWELGDEVRATAVIDDGLARDGDGAVRAALGFARHVDRFERVPELLARLDPPDVQEVLGFAHSFARRGEPRAALDLLDRAAELDPHDPRVAELRASAEADLRVHDGTWAPAVAARRIESIPGTALHLVSHSLPHHTSGGTYRTHYIVKAQRDAGLSPHVVTQIGFPFAQGAVEAPGSDVVDGITYYRIPDDDPADPTLAGRMARNLEQLVPLVERLRPAVLHPASDYVNALLALQLREIFGIPVVYEVRGFPEERLVRRPGSRVLNDTSVGRRALEIQCMQAADRIVTLAEVMTRHIVSRGVSAEKIHIAPNGVDPGALGPVPRDPGLAARLGIREGETTLGYVSTFHGYEGIRYIVEATAELIRRGRRARALLVGDGRERVALERLAADLRITDAVVFAGRVAHDQVPSFYALIDLFVVPRRAEATCELVTPLKPFEAMAAERPVIVSDVGALREVVDEGRTGRTFRADDPIDLANVVDELIDDPAQRRRLAAAGREWVTSQRTWRRNGDVYRALYEELGVA